MNSSKVETTKKINPNMNLGGQTTTMKGKANVTNSKKGGVSTQKDKEQNEDFAKKLFEDRLPLEIKLEEETKVEEQKKKDENKDKKESSEKDKVETTQLIDRKEEGTQDFRGNTEIHSSSINDISDDDRKREIQTRNANKENLEKDLDKDVFITLSETQTIFMFFVPSHRYFTVPQNDKEIEEEKKKKIVFENFIEKKRNKEQFIKRGAQTINPFRRVQEVTTSELKDEEIDKFTHVGVNALKWYIHDFFIEERTRKDDASKVFQKKLDKKIRREMKSKLKESQGLDDPNLSYSIHKSQNSSQSQSIIDTKLTSSIQSSVKRPKPKGGLKDSEEKTNMDKSSMKQHSPQSSTIVNNTQTFQSDKPISNMKVTKALDERLQNSMLYPLKFVERLLSQNKFHFKQIAYKNYPVDVGELKGKPQKALKPGTFAITDNLNDEENKVQDNMNDEEEDLVNNSSPEPKIKPLFPFSGKKVMEGFKYTVNTMDWNPFNKDLLAAGYGDADIDSKKEGLLLFWTLKNPLHPERVIHTPRGITSCHFSNKNPYYIAASDYNGEIMIYDLRVNSDKPVADSTELKDKHNDIVWEVKWVEKQNDKNEMLVSISSDGKVKEWNLKKGLEVGDLLKMKKTISLPDKTLSPFSKYTKTNKDSLVFRDANGLSFDFPKNDSTVYYIALEECTLHRCRISYKDQYTDTYYGHQGPVNKIRCNPYDPSILLTCSYDWTMKIWNSKNNYPLMNCQSMGLTHQVNDVEWSPFTSTIFGCVCDNGRVEIWDLAKQSIEPILFNVDKMTPKKSIKFSSSSHVIATGDSDFEIDIFRLYNLEHDKVSDDAQITRLQNILQANSEKR